MRYYDIKLSGGGVFGSGWTSHPGSGNVADPGAPEVLLNLEVYNASNDPQNGMAASDQSTIEIKGVSWEQIKHSNELIGKPISISGGIKPGPELATAQSRHAGQLVSGTIFKTWGNWVGTEMSIGISIIAAANSNDVSLTGAGLSSGLTAGPGGGTNAPAAPAPQMTMADAQKFRLNRTGLRSLDRRNFARGKLPVASALGGDFGLGTLSGVLGGLGLGTGTSSFGGIISSLIGGGVPGLTKPLNLIHNMQENQPLASAIAQTLTTAFPKLALEVAISPMLKLNYQDAGVYQNLEQYASYLLNLSRSILGAKNYLGVHVAVDNNKLIVWDGTAFSASEDLSTIDLIGQPTWVDVNTVEIKVVMRSHLRIGGIVTIPPGTLMNFAGGVAIIGGDSSKQRSNVTLEGIPITIKKITHIGDFRNPDGNYWCTIIVGLAANPPAVPVFGIPTTVGLGMVPPINNNAEPLGNVEIGTPIITIPPDPQNPAPQIAPQFGSMFKRSVRRH